MIQPGPKTEPKGESEPCEKTRIISCLAISPSDAWERKVLHDFFDGERLKEIPSSRKKRLVILKWLAAPHERKPPMPQQDRGQRSRPQEGASIVGAWRVDAEGAPFVPHMALFHADGTLLIHNPDAGNPQTSDSLGVGAWKVDGGHPQQIMGVFEEIMADRSTHQDMGRLRVTFTLTLDGADVFRGPAEATYYASDGTKLQDQAHQATLIGIRILP